MWYISKKIYKIHALKTCSSYSEMFLINLQTYRYGNIMYWHVNFVSPQQIPQGRCHLPAAYYSFPQRTRQINGENNLTEPDKLLSPLI